MGITDKSLGLSSLDPPFSICHTDEIHTCLFWAEQSQFSQPFITEEVLQHINNFCNSFLDLLQYICVCLVLGSPELDTGVQDWLQ